MGEILNKKIIRQFIFLIFSISPIYVAAKPSDIAVILPQDHPWFFIHSKRAIKKAIRQTNRKIRHAHDLSFRSLKFNELRYSNTYWQSDLDYKAFILVFYSNDVPRAVRESLARARLDRRRIFIWFIGQDGDSPVLPRNWDAVSSPSLEQAWQQTLQNKLLPYLEFLAQV